MMVFSRLNHINSNLILKKEVADESNNFEMLVLRKYGTTYLNEGEEKTYDYK